MMRCRRRTWLLTALLTALIAGLAVSGLALAGKPAKPGGGGGGSDPVPAGTVYFVQGDFENGFDALPRSMKADGSDKAASIEGEPSYQLHDGARWFLTSIVSGVDEWGWPTSFEFVAVADDGTVVPLGVESPEFIWGRWAKDDSFLSCELIVDGTEGTSAGLFVANVDWSLGIPIIAAPVNVLDINLYDGYYPEVYYFDWSPEGDEAVYVREERPDPNSFDAYYSLEVVRFFADGTTATRVLSESYAYAPVWSPDGSRIAYEGSGGLWTVLRDGTGALQVSSPKWPSVHLEPGWSPDSQHLVFTQSTRDKAKGAYLRTSAYDVLRISASGGGTVNLTGDTDEDCYGTAWR